MIDEAGWHWIGFLPPLPERPDNNKAVVSDGKSEDASDNRKKGEEGKSQMEVVEGKSNDKISNDYNHK